MGMSERRRRHLSIVWGGVLVIMVLITCLIGRPSSSDVPAGVIFIALIAGLAYWPNLRGSRVEYDPSTPVVVVSALAVDPGSAPFLLMAEALVLAAVDWISHRRSPSHAVANAGVFALWHGCLGLMVMRADLTGADLSLWSFAAGVTLMTAVAVMLNNLTVALSTLYLYGAADRSVDLGLGDQGRDIAFSVVLTLAVHGAPGADLPQATLAVSVLVYALWYAGRYRDHRAALMLETQARIAALEATGPLPGHSERVAEAVAALGSLHDHDPSLAETVALTHSLAIEPNRHRCAGVAPTEFVGSALRSLPRMARVRALHPVEGLPASSDPRLTHLVAAACAWDARRLPGSPVRTPDDLVYTFGIIPEVVDRVVSRDPGWVGLELRRPVGTSHRE